MEFSTEHYLEMEDEVRTFQAFRRHFPNLKVKSVKTEDIEEILENRLFGRKLDIEFHEGDQDEIKKLIKINKYGDKKI